ncbi:hypothetical protein GCM10023084_03620 [Streptomyces lacrimifluminis]|uniref:hypothetical protein n=1 Tax=Streptomyces lacrimifluminis TaxID=1500077 RepID=UPI0031EA6952
MTARHAGYIVTLAEDIREDDADHIMTALRMVSGVISVQPVTANLDMAIARQQVHGEVRGKVLQLLKELQ